ncbi:protein yippee-like B0546.4 [Nephila pilipes]|uniref:Protein yippee-like n=1 Tax=Nephila pilipes TaxID=299642 RepID=A0A8X6Q1P5_NEPPI|nr:protein yippee-like B0546.4 [Nephila pilipes]
MGVTFCEHLGGRVIYKCVKCGTYLTHRGKLVSTRFTSSNGPAWLFKEVVNVHHDNAVSKNMVTGRHIVRNVYCNSCSEQLGWFYEMTFTSGQEYKEASTILEAHLIKQEMVKTVDIPFGAHVLTG